MSAAKNAKSKPDDSIPPVPPRTQVATRDVSAIPAHLRDDISEFAGAGTSDAREDNLVPFLYIAQKGSPQVNPKDTAYIEGLVPGMIFDTSTRQMWRAEDGEGPLLLQAHFERAEVEWGLRGTADKGYKGRHPADTPLLRQITEVPKPEGRGVRRMLPNGHQLSTTAYHYFVLADDIRPVALPLSSSGLQASKTLNTLLRNKKLRAGVPSRLVVAPSFATLLRLRTYWVQNDAGDWYTVAFDDLGWVDDSHLDAYEEAKALHRSALEVGLRTAEPPAEGDDPIGSGAGMRDPGGPDPDENPADASPI